MFVAIHNYIGILDVKTYFRLFSKNWRTAFQVHIAQRLLSIDPVTKNVRKFCKFCIADSGKFHIADSGRTIVLTIKEDIARFLLNIR